MLFMLLQNGFIIILKWTPNCLESFFVLIFILANVDSCNSDQQSPLGVLNKF